MNEFKLQVFKVGALQTNCYFVIKEDKCLIFDAGDSADFILDKILELKLDPLAIFTSHGHFDHVMAVGEIQLSYDIPFYISKKDLFLLDRAKETAEYFLKHKQVFIKPKNIKDLKKGKLKIGIFEFEVVGTPGHTPGSTCFNFGDFVLTGDTLFKGTVGRYDFSYSSKSDLKKSIGQLLELSGHTIVYPGHEEETTIEEEKKGELIKRFF